MVHPFHKGIMGRSRRSELGASADEEGAMFPFQILVSHKSGRCCWWGGGWTKSPCILCGNTVSFLKHMCFDFFEWVSSLFYLVFPSFLPTTGRDILRNGRAWHSEHIDRPSPIPLPISLAKSSELWGIAGSCAGIGWPMP